MEGDPKRLLEEELAPMKAAPEDDGGKAEVLADRLDDTKREPDETGTAKEELAEVGNERKVPVEAKVLKMLAVELGVAETLLFDARAPKIIGALPNRVEGGVEAAAFELAPKSGAWGKAKTLPLPVLEAPPNPSDAGQQPKPVGAGAAADVPKNAAAAFCFAF